MFRENFQPVIQRCVRLVNKVITFIAQVVGRSIPSLQVEFLIPNITFQLIFDIVANLIIAEPQEIQFI
jgi:hypothetical protein